MYLKVSEADGAERYFAWGLGLLYPSVESGAEPDYDLACRAFDIAALHFFDRPEMFYHRGLAWVGMAAGVWASPYTGKALNDFAAALGLNSSYAEVYKARAKLLQQRNPERALADLGSLLAVQPTIDGYLSRGALLFSLKRFQLSFHDYTMACSRYLNHCGEAERRACELTVAQAKLEQTESSVLTALQLLIEFWSARAHYQHLY